MTTVNYIGRNNEKFESHPQESLSSIHNSILNCLRPVLANRKRSASTESNDSISDELHYFKPISTAPKTPPKKLPNGQILEYQVIRAKPRKLMCHYSSLIDPPYFASSSETPHLDSYSSPVGSSISDQCYDLSFIKDTSLPKFSEEKPTYEDNIELLNIPTSSNSEFYSQIKDTWSNINLSCSSLTNAFSLTSATSFENVIEENVKEKKNSRMSNKKTENEHKRKKVKGSSPESYDSNLFGNSTLQSSEETVVSCNSDNSSNNMSQESTIRYSSPPARKSRLRRRPGYCQSGASMEVKKQVELDYTLALHLQKIYNQEMQSGTAPIKSYYMLRSRSQQCLM